MGNTIQLTVEVNNTGVTREGFGLIGILSHRAWPFAGLGRSKLYSRIADAVTDGFPEDGPEVRAMKRILGQATSPPKVAILRADGAEVIKTYTVKILAAADGDVYNLNFVGEGFDDATATYTAGGGDDATDVATALAAQINAIADKNFTATPTTDTIAIVGDAAADWFEIEMEDYNLVSIAQTHSDFGVADELDAIVLRDNTWYWLDTSWNSKDYALEVAAWVEDNGKAYLVDNNDSDAVQVAVGDSPTDLQAALFGLGYKRTLYGFYHRPALNWLGGLEGVLAPKNPGNWTAKFKTVVGCPVTPLDVNQISNLDARRANYYVTEYGFPSVKEGTVANLDYGFLDTTVSLDFVANDLGSALYGAIRALDKLSYTDEDIQGVLVPAGRGTIKRCTGDEHKIMALGDVDDPENVPPSFTLPFVKDIDPAVRALRVLPNGQLSFRYQSAVHEVDVVITLSF